MRATGIVRRIDDLGRVVIPREIRRTMSIREGDPLELFLEKDKIIFTKYVVDPVGDNLLAALENARDSEDDIPTEVIRAIETAARAYNNFIKS